MFTDEAGLLVYNISSDKGQFTNYDKLCLDMYYDESIEVPLKSDLPPALQSFITSTQSYWEMFRTSMASCPCSSFEAIVSTQFSYIYKTTRVIIKFYCFVFILTGEMAQRGIPVMKCAFRG